MIIEHNGDVSPENQHTNYKIRNVFSLFLSFSLFAYYSPSLAMFLHTSLSILTFLQLIIVHSFFSPLIIAAYLSSFVSI